MKKPTSFDRSLDGPWDLLFGSNHRGEPDYTQPPQDLSSIPTALLLVIKYMRGMSQEDKDRIRVELSKRPHMPNKAERREQRQRAARKKRQRKNRE